jgi:hypothetical protein
VSRTPGARDSSAPWLLLERPVLSSESLFERHSELEYPRETDAIVSHIPNRHGESEKDVGGAALVERSRAARDAHEKCSLRYAPAWKPDLIRAARIAPCAGVPPACSLAAWRRRSCTRPARRFQGRSRASPSLAGRRNLPIRQADVVYVQTSASSARSPRAAPHRCLYATSASPAGPSASRRAVVYVQTTASPAEPSASRRAVVYVQTTALPAGPPRPVLPLLLCNERFTSGPPRRVASLFMCCL